MIDIHCHILPGIDDGAKDMDTSIEMLKIAEEDGIKKIIATPHFYRGHYENKYQDVVKKVEELNIVAMKNGIEVEILPGQEIFLDKYTLQYYKEGIIKGLNNTEYMLLELSPLEFPLYALDVIYELKLYGIKPIIAHPERYLYVNRDISILNELIEEQCFFQINAGSVRGIFGKKTQNTAIGLIKNNICDLVASDAHSTGGRRPKIKESLMEIQKQNKQNYEKIISNFTALSKGDEIFYTNRKIKENKSFLSKFIRKLIID